MVGDHMAGDPLRLLQAAAADFPGVVSARVDKEGEGSGR
jgi:hypothetical protein